MAPRTNKPHSVTLPPGLAEQLKAYGESIGVRSLSTLLAMAALQMMNKPAKRRRLITKPIDDGHLEPGTESPGNLDGRST